MKTALHNLTAKPNGRRSQMMVNNIAAVCVVAVIAFAGFAAQAHDRVYSNREVCTLMRDYYEVLHRNDPIPIPAAEKSEVYEKCLRTDPRDYSSREYCGIVMDKYGDLHRNDRIQPTGAEMNEVYEGCLRS
jgi:hypothetical protein